MTPAGIGLAIGLILGVITGFVVGFCIAADIFEGRGPEDRRK